MSETESGDGIGSEKLTRLTRGLAHDFNNLLAIIAGNIQLAADRTADPATRALLEEAEMASAMAADLIQRLKVIATDQPMRLEVIDPAAVLDQGLATFRAAAGPNISVALVCNEPLPTISTDRNALLNAVLNLVCNARDAMPGGGAIEIEVGGSSEDGSAVRITVRDTGRGMPPEILRRAFDPYFSTKSPDGGRGLGLTSVLGFARQCGGDVAIDSRPGKGTRVTLTLPAHDA